MVREGLAALCQTHPKYRVTAQCPDFPTAIREIESEMPDIAVLDSNLPGFSLESVRKLRAAQVSTRIVVLAKQQDRRTLVEVLRSGVNAFVLESVPAEHLFEALAQVLAGGIYVSPALEMDKVFSSGLKSIPKDPLRALSPREYQVFALLIEGNRVKEIAARLDLSAKTIDTYRVNLMRKLDTHHIAGLVKLALQHQLTQRDPAKSMSKASASR